MKALGEQWRRIRKPAVGWALQHRRLLVGLAAVAVCYLVAGFFILPPVVRRVLPARISTALGANVTVQQIRMNPLTLSATLRGVTLSDRMGGEFCRFDEGYLNFQLSSIIQRTFVLREAALKKPSCRVVIDKEGRSNVPQPAAEPDAKEPAAPSSSPPLRIYDLSITDGKFEFRNEALPDPFERKASSITLAAKDFTLARGTTAASLAAMTTRGDRLTWDGSVTFDPLELKGLVTIEAELAGPSDYFTELLDFQVPEGTASLRAKVQFGGNPAGWELTDGHAEVTNLKVAAKAGGDLIKARRTELSGVEMRAADRRVVIRSAQSEHGAIRVRRSKEGAVNLSALRFHSRAAAEASPAAAPAWSIALQNTALRDYQVSYKDAALDAGTLTVKFGAFEVHDLESGKPPGTASCTASIGSGSLQGSGSLALTPFQLRLTTDVAGVPLPLVSPYVIAGRDLQPFQGSLAGKLSLVYGKQVDTDPLLRVTGEAWADGVQIAQQSSGEAVASATRAEAAGLAVAVLPTALSLDRLTLKEPLIHARIRSDGTLNLKQALARPAPAPAADAHPPAEAAPAPALVQCREIVLEPGAVELIDQAVRPSYQGRLEISGAEIRGYASDLHEQIELDLQGVLDRHSPLALKGKLAPGELLKSGQVTVMLRELSLPALSGYSVRYLGYPVRRGLLNWVGEAQISDKTLRAENAFELGQLQIGDRAPDSKAPDLPLPFAVSLLRDNSGEIHLNLPVQGRIDQPNFRYFGAVRRELMKLVARAAASPFTFLASAVGASDEIRWVAFAPGSAVLSAHERDKLTLVAGALKDREHLQLTVQGLAVPHYDFPTISVLEPELRRLADARAAAVEDYLLEQAPALHGRILLAAPETNERDVTDSLEMELTLSER